MAARPSRLRGRLSLAALLTAVAISQVGTMLTGVALPWYVLTTTGSAARGASLPRRSVLLGGLALAGLPLWAVAPLPAPALALPLLALMGLGVGPLGPLTMTLLAERTPEALRGRVFGAFSTLVNMSIPLGVLCTGFIVQGAGTRASILVLAACYVLPLLAALVGHVYRLWPWSGRHPSGQGAVGLGA